MKRLFSNVFTKHLYAFACTLFFFLSVSFNAYSQGPVTIQCQGLTMSLSSDLTTDGTAIPFGTPITITTTITNTSITAQTVDLELIVSPNFPVPHFDVLCADDYIWNGFSGQRHSLSIGVGEQVVSRMRVVYNVASTDPVSDGRKFRARFTFSNGNICTTPNLVIRTRNTDAQVIGVPGQMTTINSLQPSNTGSLIVRGNVILDVDHVLSPIGNPPGIFFPYIYMDEGATLTVASGRTLNISGAKIFGIRTLWNSIVVESGATLKIGSIHRTTIKDGIRAIEARGGSNIEIFNTLFEDNITSLHVPPTSGNLQNINFINPFIYCDFNGTGELRPMPTGTLNCSTDKIAGYPYTGLDINDLGSLLTVGGTLTPRTSFRNMSNGIVARRTRLFVNRGKFENIKSSYVNQHGLGIYSYGPNSQLLVAGNYGSQDLDFFNCSTAIAYQQFGFNDLAQVNSINVDNTGDDTGFGITAAVNYSNQSFLYAMNIKAKVGIRSFWNTSNVGEIYNNYMEIGNPITPSVSGGILAQELFNTGNWNIYGNEILLQNAQTGIRFNSGSGATVTNNFLTFLGGSPNNYTGIQSGGSSNCAINCNSISGSGGSASSGLFVSGGTGLSYTCNNTSQTQFGMNITGQSTPFTMDANRFNNHNIGLQLNSDAVIGVQSFRGNKWQGPFISFGAVHLDPIPNNVRLSQFVVGSPNAPIMPTFSASDPDWFKFINGTDATCTSLNACPNGNPAGRIAGGGTTIEESFYTSAISEARMQTPNAEEVKWTAQRNAYGRLMRNPSEQNNRDKANFIGRMRNTSTGQLYQVEKGVKDAHNIGREYNDVLMSNANTIKTLANEIADLDAKIFTAKDAEKKALIAQKKEKNATIHRLSTENAPRHATIERKRNQEIQRLIRDNERISTRLQPEINEKEVYAIYLATVAQGKMELNSEQKATVRLIAYQCPSLGGNAVFAARSLYALVENVNFDDLALCNARSEPVQGLKIKKVETFKISPNPATDMLTVNQSTEKAETGEWLIFDTAGKLLLSKKVTENETQTNINIQGLSEGIYFVSFVVNGEKRFNQKFIKIKSN